MTSLAESSVGSVPIPQVEKLRRQMLMHVEADSVAPEQTLTGGRPQHHPAQDASQGLHAHVEPPSSGDSIIPQSQDADPAPATPTLKIRPPLLLPSASAPAKEMENMLDVTASQNAFRLLTKAASFHAYPDGDTQPMESQVYRDFHESMAHPPTEATSERALEHAGQSPSLHTLSVNRTMRTCQEGDTGYIDLEGAFQPASPSSTGGFDELLASPQIQAQANTHMATHGTFAMPETPALAGGRRRGQDGEPFTSATTTTTKKTPAYSQLFGMAATGPVLSATQLFNQTQALSSPIPDQLRSDPVVSRPSPNINGHPVASSPLNAFSSPIVAAGAQLPGTVDPKGTYTSMRESQERRLARLRQELGRPAQGDDDFWNDESNESVSQPRWQGRRMRRVMSDHAIPDVSKLNAPTRSSSRPSSANNALHPTTIMETPAAVQRGERLEFDDAFLEGDSEGDDANENEDDPEEPNDNDEYDELAQVLRSQANDEGAGGDTDAEVGDVSEQPAREARNERTRSSLIGQHHEPNRPPTQQSAIADSQQGTQDKTKYTTTTYGKHQSSSASFIPGSQYTGRTSEDQARLAASQYSRASQNAAQEKISSSPPLPINDGSAGEDASEPPTVRMPYIQESTNPTSHRADENTELEVPESDLPEISYSRPYTSASHGESNSLPIFLTAQTHTSNPIASPLKVFASQQSRVSEFSPRKAAGVRRFSEFPSISPPDGSSAIQLDIDAVMNDVMTAEDQEYMEAVASSPETRSRKRRKIGRNTSMPRPPRTAQGTTVNQPTKISSRVQPEVMLDKTNVESTRRRSASRKGSPTSLEKDKESVSTSRELHEVPDSTSNSVRAREEAGAKAVSQLLSRRTSRASNSSKAKPRSKVAQRSTRVNLHASTDRSAEEANHEIPGVGATADRETAREPETAKDSTEPATKVNEDPEAKTAHVTPAISHPERTFALFKGRYNQYFPATWLASGPDQSTYRVQFDEKTTTDIEAHHVCTLELRIGDTVKVDHASMRKESWVVVGFGPVVTTTPEYAMGVDVHGRNHILVQAKSTRNSAGGADVTTLLKGVPTHEVLITNVYITQTMWKHFSGRTFEPPASLKHNSARAETPACLPQTPIVDTPASRTRRSAQMKAQETHASHTHHHEGVHTPPISAAPSGIFQGMAFAMSFTPKAEHNRASTTALIQQNGGIVFESSFRELFDVPGLDNKKESPKKAIGATGADGDVLTTQIKPEFKRLGFVALISDQHNRKAKYIQALALGLPTLSARWITDCLDPSKNKSLATSQPTLLGWGNYLLPAGESSYLGGAIRSRTLAVEDTTWTKLPATISARPRLLRDEGVLIFPGKNKNTRENRDMFAFLTLALGARRVRRVAHLKETKALLDQEAEDWQWVYVDGEVAEAAAELFGDDARAQGIAVRGKKRKRGQEPAAQILAKTSATDGKVRVVNDEFVIQSLILGALVD